MCTFHLYFIFNLGLILGLCVCVCVNSRIISLFFLQIIQIVDFHATGGAMVSDCSL